MLDDVQRRRFLVKPARKGALPFPVGPLDIDLDERAGEFFRLPRRSRFARPQPDDHILPARRLAGMQGDVLDDAVALVENAEDRDALRHRGNPGLVGATCRRGGIAGRWSGRILLIAAAPARREAERARRQQ
jgi:hypothetical protein